MNKIRAAALASMLLLLGAAMAGPVQAQSNFQAGRAADQAGNCAEAINHYTRSIDQREVRGELIAIVYFARATCHAKLRHNEQAIADYNETLRNNPKIVEAYIGRAAVLADSKQYDKALADVEQALKMAPNHPVVLLTRAQIYLDKGDSKRALPDLDRVIAAVPDDPNALFMRALAHFDQKNKPQALADAERALRFAPTRPDILVLSITLKADAKRLDEALAEADRLLKFNPPTPVALTLRGDIHKEKGRRDLALRDFDAALKMDPNHFPALRSRAILHMENGQWARAAADFELAARQPEAKDDDPIMGAHLFVARQRTGRADARTGLEQHIAGLGGKWAEQVGKFLLGQISEQELLMAAAVTSVEKSRENECEARYFIGQAALMRGDKQAAIAAFKASIETGVTQFIEYSLSKAELARLGVK